MAVEVESVSQPPSEFHEPEPKVDRYERNRLIAHLGRTFARRYDIAVIPSRQKGLWACGLDPKVNQEVMKFIDGERETLDDLSPESFKARQIMYDAESAQDMTMDEITTLLHHEAGHAKYTDFRLMFEGQRKAKDDGYLPTSFWLTFEGIEDPRINGLEGEESPAIDRLIRTNQDKELQKRITEMPLTDRPYMMQFAYESFYHWLHGKGIPELAETEVGKLGELAAPLLEQYFHNTDVDERKLLQQQIWDIARTLEKKDLEDEEKRQMAQQQGMKGQESQGQGEGQASGGSGQDGEGVGTPYIPGGKGQREGAGFIDRLRQAIFGPKNNESQAGQGEQTPKPERFDLSKLSDEQLQQIQEAIDQLTPEEKAALEKKARQTIDELQKQGLEDDFNKTYKLERNKQTGEYEVTPQLADEGTQKKASEDYDKVLKEVEADEEAERQAIEAARRQEEQRFRQMEAARREKLEMEKMGFDPETEREKYRLYKALEDSMYANIRNFRQAIEKVIPRKGEARYEGGYFSGPKFDRRDIVRKAPLGDERFHLRQIERPTGAPRLFIGLVVDNSGSMGPKMDQARKTMIFFAEVCKQMGIPFMGVAFGDDAEVIKTFREDFDSPADRIKPKIIDYTDASGGSTNLHAGIETVIESMNDARRKYPDSHGLIFVITDGGANRGLTGEALRDFVEENRGRLTFKAFGLSSSAHERQAIQEYLNLYFGESNCAYPEGFKDLPDEAFRVLRVNLMQFQRFLS